jgi:hypothetical protein
MNSQSLQSENENVVNASRDLRLAFKNRVLLTTFATLNLLQHHNTR